MKTKLLKTLVLLFLSSAMLFAVSCTVTETPSSESQIEDESIVHVCDFSELKKDETNHWFECECGEKDLEESHIGGLATCTELAKCSVCSQSYGELLAHEYLHLKNNDTHHWYECSCGAKEEKVAHVGSDATCEEASYCLICGYRITDALRHVYVISDKVDPTCMSTGLTAGLHCLRCGEVLVVQEEIPASGHTLVLEVAKDPTCTETGLTAGEYCLVCDYRVAQEELAALGHNSVVDEGVEKTCTEDGLTEGSHCDVCGKVLVAQKVISASHTIVVDPAVPPTATSTGLTQGSHCGECGVILVKQYVVTLSDCAIVELAAGEQITADLILNDLLDGAYTDTGKFPDISGGISLSFDPFDAYEVKVNGTAVKYFNVGFLGSIDLTPINAVHGQTYSYEVRKYHLAYEGNWYNKKWTKAEDTSFSPVTGAFIVQIAGYAGLSMVGVDDATKDLLPTEASGAVIPKTSTLDSLTINGETVKRSSTEFVYTANTAVTVVATLSEEYFLGIGDKNKIVSKITVKAGDEVAHEFFNTNGDLAFSATFTAKAATNYTISVEVADTANKIVVNGDVDASFIDDIAGTLENLGNAITGFDKVGANKQITLTLTPKNDGEEITAWTLKNQEGNDVACTEERDGNKVKITFTTGMAQVYTVDVITANLDSSLNVEGNVDVEANVDLSAVPANTELLHFR